MDDKKIDQIYDELKSQRALLMELSTNVTSLSKDINYLKLQLNNYEKRLAKVEENVDNLTTESQTNKKLNEQREKDRIAVTEKQDIIMKKYTLLVGVMMAIFTAVQVIINILRI